MTKQSNAELIAEARSQASQPMLGKTQWRELDKAILTIRRLADALEAAEQRAEKAEGERDLFKREQVSTVLAAPTDALREVKAEVWDEASEATAEHIENGGEYDLPNPYRAREEQS